jgi:hypothetical protein
MITLISRSALLPCRDSTTDHRKDNFLLEMQEALRSQSFILPVFIGEYQEYQDELLRKFKDFKINSIIYSSKWKMIR